MIPVSDKIVCVLEKIAPVDLNELDAAVDANNDARCIQIMSKYDPAVEEEYYTTGSDADARLHEAFLSGMLDWGNYAVYYDKLHPTKPVVRETPLPDPDADWRMPTIRLRKDVWENFPVCLDKIAPTKDGRERYVVQWHRKNYQDAFRAAFENAEHAWQYMDFEDDIYRRLMKSLQSCRGWTVEEATGDRDICVLVMVPPMPTVAVSEAEATAETKKILVVDENKLNDEAAADGWTTVGKPATTANANTKAPVLVKLTDIKMHFPVVWNEVPNTKRKTYAIDLFGKKIKEQGLNANTVRGSLIDALKKSPSWTVKTTSNSGNSVCTIEMRY